MSEGHCYCCCSCKLWLDRWSVLLLLVMVGGRSCFGGLDGLLAELLSLERGKMERGAAEAERAKGEGRGRKGISTCRSRQINESISIADFFPPN